MLYLLSMFIAIWMSWVRLGNECGRLQFTGGKIYENRPFRMECLLERQLHSTYYGYSVMMWYLTSIHHPLSCINICLNWCHLSLLRPFPSFDAHLWCHRSWVHWTIRHLVLLEMRRITLDQHDGSVAREFPNLGWGFARKVWKVLSWAKSHMSRADHWRDREFNSLFNSPRKNKIYHRSYLVTARSVTKLKSGEAWDDKLYVSNLRQLKAV